MDSSRPLGKTLCPLDLRLIKALSVVRGVKMSRCCCGRLMGEHSWKESPPPVSLHPGPGQDLEEEDWSVELHTKASPTNAYGIVDFEDTATRVCRAKYVRVAVDSKPEALLQLMLREWQMERPKLLLTVQGGSENFSLPPKVEQAFSKGLMTAALSTGAWILTDGINTGRHTKNLTVKHRDLCQSKYVGEAQKTFGGPDLRKRNTVGITPWGVIDNNTSLIGRDVFRPYQPLGNPLSKRACLNGFHSHFLLVDDGTLGKHGCQQGVRKKLEKHIQLQKIHPRLNQGVPVVCVVVEGGPAIISNVLDYVSSVPPVPVFVFEGSGRAADLLAFLHKQTAVDRQLDADIREDFLVRIGNVFGVDRAEASQLYSLLLQCMAHRQSITIFDSESEEHMTPDAAILTTTLKGTKASPAEQLSMALAWDRADIAQKDVLVYGQHWQVGSLEQAMLDAVVMDRVSFVKLLIDNGMTMSRFLTVDRLEELYNTPQAQTDRFLQHLVEDVKQTSLPIGYRLSLIDIGLVIEYLIGGAYRSTYTRKHFRAAYVRLQDKDGRRDSSTSLSKQRRGLILNSSRARSPQNLQFFRTAQPYKPKEQGESPGSSPEITLSPGLGDPPLLVAFNFNDLFVWAVLHQRQQMALFLWQHGEEALARATVACKLYRSMAFEARQSSMDDNMAERFKTYSLEFGRLAVDVLDCAFRQNEQMAMKLLTSEMEAWSHFTCLQMAVSSCHRPFVSHSCTQTLLTDLWTGPLNMRKNSHLKIIWSLLLPPAILVLEFKSKAEMCHVPQSHEAMLFGLDTAKSVPAHEETDHTDAERGPSFCDKCLGPVSETVSSVTVHCLSWITRLYEFYTAPVVKFWFHTMSYLAFLMLFSYVVLVKMEERPSVQEWLVIAYILSTAVEKTREVLMSEPRKLSQKLKIWFSEYWNISDFIAILLFLAGLAMRWHDKPYWTAGRISYCLDIIFWFVRVLDLLAVNQHAGPYLTMITKMTRNMFFIVVMMAIVLLSFGVSRKAILSPDEEPSWSLARDVVFMPYWMIYGEVYADRDSNIYFDMASTSNKLWKYNRYRYIMTYQERPWLPPPLIVLSHVTSALRVIYRRCKGGAEREERGTGLKLLLGHEDRKKLHEFEEKCVQAYFHERSDGQDSSQINRIRATAERTEEMCTMAAEVSEKVNFIQNSLSDLDGQLGQLQDLSALAVDTLTLLSASDSRHQEEACLAQCRPVAASRHILPHSWTLPHRSGADCDVLNEESSMEEEEDEEEEEQGEERKLSDTVSKASSTAGLLSDPQDISEGLVNPAFTDDEGQPEFSVQTFQPMGKTCETAQVAVQSHLSDACWRRCRRLRGEARCWSASTSLNQLNFEPMDLLQKQMFSHQDMWSPTHSAWNSWAISMSRRSSLQSGVAPEVKSSPFQSTENLYPHYSAMERNNLMRLAHNIPFTPVSIMGGEEVSIYSLEEVPSESNTASSWSSRGLSAMLQPLSSEEGSLDGGLRQGCRVLCTWAEQNVLKPGLVYVVKAFRSEVVRAWQRYFHGSTALQLCLREIQQQRAAQKMMQCVQPGQTRRHAPLAEVSGRLAGPLAFKRPVADHREEHVRRLQEVQQQHRRGDRPLAVRWRKRCSRSLIGRTSTRAESSWCSTYKELERR
ncbi:Transient receptor potential cation channel subfamily M member 6 [Larimichthys crocea]|uniref:Uncharacterized protein n=1 Tax=Larimichthys crocea TaxID=215358 RepID=A0ACD3Q9B9_LARCR|nr:Transient receptor potential cation channel subfamily M member 6 [Larimichthys crocea]